MHSPLTANEQRELFKKAVMDDIIFVKNFVNSHTYGTQWIHQVVDEYNQTLLHIAIRCRNFALTKYLLLDQEMFYESTIDVFGELPLDIALKNYDKKIIQLFVERKTLYCEKKLRESEKRLKSEVDSKKRLRDDNEELDRVNKKLKKDVLTYQEMLSNK